MKKRIVSESEAAEQIGVSVRSLRLMAACGMAGAPRDYSPTFPTVAELARWFGVSERTAHTWKAAGMPMNPDGTYSQQAVLDWRRNRPNPEPWHATGNRELSPRPATGDLVRAIYRTQRVHLGEAIMNAIDDALPSNGKNSKRREELFNILGNHLAECVPTDEEVEQTLIECWNFI